MEHICPSKRILGVNAGHWGAMADFFTCHQRQAFPARSPSRSCDWSFCRAACCGSSCCEPDESAQERNLAIVGAGTIGLALLVVLRNAGFESVFIIDKIDDKLKLAREFGAKTINADRELPAQVIADETPAFCGLTAFSKRWDWLNRCGRLMISATSAAQSFSSEIWLKSSRFLYRE
jgi:threonine dehydrogenase-like Zn-dependent dehydrogenase